MEKAGLMLEKNNGTVVAISISSQKGVPKDNVEKAELKENFGIINDAHAGQNHRQVSLLAMESIDNVRKKLPEVKPGDFAENITTRGINLPELEIGTKLQIGNDVVLEVTQIGKECHDRCNIYELTGDCVMPKEGIFTKVLKGGEIFIGDKIN